MDSDVGIESGRMYMILWKASESGFIIQIGSIKRFVTSAKIQRPVAQKMIRFPP